MNEVDNIILNENAYFYQKLSANRLSDRYINSIFTDAVVDKGGNRLLDEKNISHTIDGVTVNYSILVINYQHKPTFLSERQTGWDETKLAYLVILDFDRFVVISKKNISGIQTFINSLVPLDYKVISTLFVDDNTEFEKFAMTNMNISDTSIRSKSLEASDLKNSFYSLGANTYMLRGMRLKNGEDKISLAPNTSRINRYGNKNNIIGFLEWSKALLDRIQTYTDHETYLSIFAEPMDYEAERDRLTPIAILLLFTKLYEDIDNEKIVGAIYELEEDVTRPISITNFIDNFERLSKVEEDTSGSRVVYKVLNPKIDDIELRKLGKSIRIKSKKLRKIKLIKEDNSSISFVEYLNNSNSFVVNFQDLDLIYSNRKLFKDSRLLGNIDAFLNIFLPYTDLQTTTTEKGSFSTTQTEFTNNSLFHFVENKFANPSDFLICDDLSKEWADHIALSSTTVSFFHSKYKDAKFSASAFQDVVGQAQKNLGNMTPADYQWDIKENFWKRQYRNNNVQTQIDRLRKGSSVDNAILHYKELIRNPNLKREVYLVINFISKAELGDRIEKLKNNQPFTERNEVIQIVWFISSLVASCKEVGVDAFICCKP